MNGGEPEFVKDRVSVSFQVAQLFTISRLFTITFRTAVFTLTTRSIRADGITTFAFGATSVGTAITLGAAVAFRTTAFRATITFRAAVSIDAAMQRAITFWSAITGTRAFAIARRTHWSADQLERIELSVMIGVEFIEEVRQLGPLVLRDAAIVVLVEFANEQRTARSLRTTVSLGAAFFRTSCLGTTIAFWTATFLWAIPFRTTAFGTTVSLAPLAIGSATFRGAISFTTFTFRTTAFRGAIALRATFAF